MTGQRRVLTIALVALAGGLAAVFFDVIGAGQANFALTGSATVPGGGAAPLQFTPASVSAR